MPNQAKPRNVDPLAPLCSDQPASVFSIVVGTTNWVYQAPAPTTVTAFCRSVNFCVTEYWPAGRYTPVQVPVVSIRTLSSAACTSPWAKPVGTV